MTASSEPHRWPVASQRQLAGWRKLSLKKERERKGLLVLEGVRLVSEALACRVEVLALVVADDGQGAAAVQHLPDREIVRVGAQVRVPRRDFDRLTDTVHAAGIAAVVRWAPAPFDSDPAAVTKGGRGVVADRFSDPGNLGTLIRTAAAFGVDHVLLTPDTVELANPKVVRATAGALFRVPVHVDVPVPAIGDWCIRNRVPILVADAHRGCEPSPDEFRNGWMLVVGGETLPLSSEWGGVPVKRVHIPMARGVESLNAAVAGAILIDRLTEPRHVSGGRDGATPRRKLRRR